MSNTKQLMLGWMAYASDNNDHLINNFGATHTYNSVVAGTYENWVNNLMSWDNSTMNTNPDLIRNGILSPYLNKNLGVYKCPGDNFLSAVQRSAGFTTRTRSMAMNSFLGAYGPRGAGKDYHNGYNNNYPAYRQWLKLGQIAKPSSIFVTIDEHPDTNNDGLFNNNPDWATATRWSDAPASFHNGGAGVSFADGHSEIHRWQSAATKMPVLYVEMPARTSSMLPFDALAREDLRWMVERQAVLHPNF